ncbi:MAG TPA: S8 family serine peptidase [Candidatus Thermoplasmatota archaeon]|jgi:serine protease|nr:S8 family serine peptidase [Candidatus Thermoplasmatota archaeon]
MLPAHPLLVALLSIALAVPAPAGTALLGDNGGGLLGPDPAPDDAAVRLLVGFREALPEDPAAFAASTGTALLGSIAPLRVLIVTVPPEDVADAIARLLAAPGVAYAEPDHAVQATFEPGDVLYGLGLQWAPAAVRLPAAWDHAQGTHDITIAMLDTGIDKAHADLLDNLCDDGAAFLTGSGIAVPLATEDDNGHGTHTAGIAAAGLDNLVGIAGASNSCLMAVKVLNAAGSGFSSDVAAGLAYATDRGARIASMSLGSPDSDATLQRAVEYALAGGVLVVAAAGNAGCDGSADTVDYPGRYPAVLTVAALATPTTVADYSSCGPEVDIAAPGSDVWSTYPGNSYWSLSGTSMATPLVAGIAALAWSCHPDWNAGQVRWALRVTADGLGAPPEQVGAGRVDALGAVQATGCA